MTVDFRCEKCGKLLSVDAAEGSNIRCPHCNKKVQVPTALASLPRPQVPPGTLPPLRPSSDGEQGPDYKQNTVPPTEADPIMTLMASLMPWVLSIFLHIGVGMIMALIVMISYGEQPTAKTPEEAPRDYIPDMMDVGKRQSLEDMTRQKVSERTYAQRESAINATAGKTDKRVPLIGAGVSSGTGDITGGSPTGRGPGFYGSRGGGNVSHVVYVIDRSGSMIEHFEEIKMQMIKSISRLSIEQDFHVILFGEDKTIENDPGKLVHADDAQKAGVLKFLKEDKVRPGGTTTALPALKRAFEVLKAADSSKRGQVIYLLTDGGFGGRSGGSRYKGAVGNEAVVGWLKDNNKDGKIHVWTYLYGRDPEAIKVMTRIANKNGGRFKLIDEN